MLPGSYLIICSAISWSGRPFIDGIFGAVKRLHGIETGTATIAFGAGLLVFVAITSLVGLVLASLAHTLIERPWNYFSRLSDEGMRRSFGASTLARLQQRFESQFGYPVPTESKSLNGASGLCIYHLYAVSPGLGLIATRHDAGSLAARSLVLATAALIGITIAARRFDSFAMVWLSILLLIGLGAALTFAYHRKKRVYSRFALYLATPTEPISEKSHARERTR